MLTKLALKNVGKSLKDYAIYFFTLVFGVCVFYMFNSIYAQQEMMVFTKSMNQYLVAFRGLLSYVSIFVAIVMGFLIVYANNFFIKRRKKELGIYMTLGMNKNKISLILILETSLIALIALGVGLVLGVFASQFMSVFTAKVFEADMMEYRFVFAPEAVLQSVLYFGVIFLIVIVFNTFTIRKFKLIDLIYGGVKNQTLKMGGAKFFVVLFVLSVLFLTGAYILILKNGLLMINKVFLISIIMGIIGTVLFFLSISGILSRILPKRKKLYYKGLNMFVFRQLISKIHSNYASISVVCIALLLTIGIFACGYTLQDIFSNDLRSTIPYDFTLAYSYDDEAKNDFSELPTITEMLSEEYISNENVKGYREAIKYDSSNAVINFPSGMIPDADQERDIRQRMTFVGVSDYNGMLKLNNLDEYQLPKDTFSMIACQTDVASMFEKMAEMGMTIEIDGKTLMPTKNVVEHAFENEFAVFNFTVIIPDEYLSALEPQYTVLNIICHNAAAADKYYELLENDNRGSTYGYGFHYTASRAELYAAQIGTKAVISFLAIYLGTVFMITCAAIIAIQQLSEVADSKPRYALLKKIGADGKLINKTIFIQTLCYFLAPLMLAIVHSTIGLIAAHDVFSEYGELNIAGSLIATAVFVVALYSVYFCITYIGCKNIIKSDNIQ